ALAAAGDLAAAAASFREAVNDSSYATPYKAYLGLGNALLKSGNPTDAGVAFRAAAIDGANPAPALALASLGECFLKIGRPDDAVESYRTALDFVAAHDDPNAINAGLGAALVAAQRHSEAIEAFSRATAAGVYQLTPEQQQALSLAEDTLSAQRSMAPVTNTGAYPVGVDPLDPLGQSGAIIPDPSDTGFFTLSESEMIQQDRKEMKVRRKHRHTGLKVFLVILFLLVAVAGGLGFAYTRGLGYPSQQDAITGLFKAVDEGTDASPFLASGLSDDSKSIIVASIPTGAIPTIEGLDQSMTESTATVKVQLSKGGTATYEVEFVREGIGWAVSRVELDFGNADDDAKTSTDAKDAGSSTDAGAGSGSSEM
ncbi:MAG: tetratricopeptide repeat protein, partial [Collinsella sp.]|nr:tetratricopeptide repeat protein [Collinsella sp.]